jgi:hypothetical protein
MEVIDSSEVPFRLAIDQGHTVFLRGRTDITPFALCCFDPQPQTDFFDAPSLDGMRRLVSAERAMMPSATHSRCKGDQPMKKSNREAEWKERPSQTVGIDLGDRFSHYCVLNSDGEVVEQGRIRTSEEKFRLHFEGEPRERIVIESGTHSPGSVVL